MAITGAVAAAVRKFDPYPNDLLALDFAGVATGGRPFYKREGIIVPRYEMLPGALSTGHAGFGTQQVNTAWRGFPANAPLIGDGGLGVWEGRTNSIRNPTGAGGSAGVWPTNWSPVSSTVGLTVTPVGQVISAKGLPGFAFRVQGTATVPLFRLQLEGMGQAAAAPGQIWITALETELLAGDWSNVSNVYISHFYRAASNVSTGSATSPQRAPASSGAEGWRTSDVAAPANTTQVTPELDITMSTTLPVDFTVAIYAPNLKLGADINDPPILQTSGLAATRTAVAQSVGGLNLPPVGYIYAEWVQPIIQTTTRTYVWNVEDFSSAKRLNLRASAGGRDDIEFVVGDASTNSALSIATPPSPGAVCRAVCAYDTTAAQMAFAFNGADQTAARQLSADTIANAAIGLGQGGSRANIGPNTGQFNSTLRRLRIVPGWPSEAERIALTSA